MMMGRTFMVMQDDRSNNGGSRSKKQKPNKIPQRGLGVAQLEKIIKEEQKKNAGVTATPSFISPPSPPHPPPPPPQQQMPLPFLAPPDPKSSCYRSPREQSCLFRPPLAPFMLPANSWNSIQHSSTESERKHASTSCWRASSLTQHQASRVNKALSSSSSGVNFQMEPPSNQNVISNFAIPPSRPDNDYTIDGVKRLYPFRLDHSSSCGVSSLHTSFCKPDESFPNDPNHQITMSSGTNLRETTQNSNTNRVYWKRNRNGGAMDDGFLSLSSPCQEPHKTKSSQWIAPVQAHYSVCAEINFTPKQDADLQNHGPRRQPFYNFLPTGSINTEIIYSSKLNEGSDDLDLNLKL